MRDQTGHYALGHSPHDPIFELVGLNLPALACDIEPDRVVGIGTQEVVDWDPVGGGNLQIEGDRGPGTQDEHVRPDGDWRQDRRSGHHIVQAPRQIFTVELYADFLLCLPNGGSQEIRVLRFSATAGQSHVPGPGIPGPLGTADKEDGVWIGSEDDCHGSPHKGRIVVAAGLVVSQALAEASEPAGQCECDWQPPPQQPPGGGPRRL